MAGLVKELLIDLNKLDIDTRLDFIVAIKSLYAARVISKYEIFVLDCYLSGYSAHEIAQMTKHKTADQITEILSRIVSAIEYASGYLDIHLVNRVAPRYSPHQLKRLKQYLTEHGQDFSYQKECKE